MISPFTYADPMIFLRELNGSDDIVVVLKRALAEFDDAIDNAFEKHTLVTEEKCINAWVSVCLLDAALNGTDYSDEESGCEAAYRDAVKALHTALSKKRFLSTKPVYDIEAIKAAAFDQLVNLDDEEHTELAKKISQTEDEPAFREAITELMERLTPESAK